MPALTIEELGAFTESVDGELRRVARALGLLR